MKSYIGLLVWLVCVGILIYGAFRFVYPEQHNALVPSQQERPMNEGR